MTGRRSHGRLSALNGVVHQGIYGRVPHITLKSIANNAEIDVIWERSQETLEPLRDDLNVRLDCDWAEWEIPREASEAWPPEAVATHRLWWEARIARQREVDASIAARADYEYLYDKPYEDNRKVRVAGPFTVESVSPHRVLAVDENDELLDRATETRPDGPQKDFARMILEQLATAGVQQAPCVRRPSIWCRVSPAASPRGRVPDASARCRLRRRPNCSTTNRASASASHFHWSTWALVSATRLMSLRLSQTMNRAASRGPAGIVCTGMT